MTFVPINIRCCSLSYSSSTSRGESNKKLCLCSTLAVAGDGPFFILLWIILLVRIAVEI